MKPLHIILFLLLTTIAYGQKEVTIAMHGDLDDDLFILKASSTGTKVLACMQMHNPTDRFYYDHRMVPSKKIYGMIDIEKHLHLSEGETLLVMTANEREEVHNKKRLYQRTHFKSVELYANGEVLIPSLMPEKQDVPGYPLWFGPDDTPLHPLAKGYNYYKLWENAIVNLGIIFPDQGKYRLYFIDHQQKILFSKEIRATKTLQNLKLIGEHPLMEVNGRVFDGASFDEEDQEVRNKAIEGIVILSKKSTTYVPLPYPFPYINRIFIKGL